MSTNFDKSTVTEFQEMIREATFAYQAHSIDYGRFQLQLDSFMKAHKVGLEEMKGLLSKLDYRVLQWANSMFIDMQDSPVYLATDFLYGLARTCINEHESRVDGMSDQIKSMFGGNGSGYPGTLESKLELLNSMYGCTMRDLAGIINCSWPMVHSVWREIEATRSGVRSAAGFPLVDELTKHIIKPKS